MTETATRWNCLLSNMNGGVCGTQAHSLNEFGAEQEPLSPVDPSGPHVYTQTNWRPSPTPLILPFTALSYAVSRLQATLLSCSEKDLPSITLL